MTQTKCLPRHTVAITRTLLCPETDLLPPPVRMLIATRYGVYNNYATRLQHVSHLQLAIIFM